MLRWVYDECGPGDDLDISSDNSYGDNLDAGDDSYCDDCGPGNGSADISSSFTEWCMFCNAERSEH